MITEACQCCQQLIFHTPDVGIEVQIFTEGKFHDNAAPKLYMVIFTSKEQQAQCTWKTIPVCLDTERKMSFRSIFWHQTSCHIVHYYWLLSNMASVGGQCKLVSNVGEAVCHHFQLSE